MFSERLAKLANQAPLEASNGFSNEPESTKEKAIEKDMQEAIRNHQFKVYYQSKHSTKDGKIVGAEALSRWEHSEFGLITPSEYIPVFEANGTIKKLDLYVLEQVCADIERWKENGYKIIPISVNLSRIDFDNSDLIDKVNAIVKRHGVDPSLLCFEITETAYTDNQSMIVYLVNQFRAAGYKIGLDDFGSGYSSLAMVNALKLDTLKIDKELVNGVKNNGDKFLLDTCIKISERYDLQSEAEGVEDREQFEILRNLNCDSVQGFYFSRPIPVEAFELRLQN